jgi:hypothetical protein
MLQIKKPAHSVGVSTSTKRKTDCEIEAIEPSVCKKRMNCTPMTSQLNSLMDNWHLDAKRRQVNLTEDMIRQKAITYAEALDMEKVVTNKQWMDRFKARNNIVLRSIDVDLALFGEEIVSRYGLKVPAPKAAQVQDWLPVDVNVMTESKPAKQEQLVKPVEKKEMAKDARELIDRMERFALEHQLSHLAKIRQIKASYLIAVTTSSKKNQATLDRFISRK